MLCRMPNRSGKPKHPKRPRDTNKLAKHIVDLAIGEAEGEEQPAEDEGRDPSAVTLGRKGGLKGGKARASKLSKKRRQEIARKAAQSRWKKRETD